MKQRILGLDLGINSVGWAIVDDDNDAQVDLLDWGSRIFAPGLAATTEEIVSGKGESRCAERRLKRAQRIAYRRRRQHKDELTRVLSGSGLLPEQVSPEFFLQIDRAFLAGLPEDEQKRAAHVVPYLLRAAALDRPLEPMQLGRALYHLGQRRGYKSNRKQEAKDSEAGVVLSQIAELKEAIRNSGARTLGEYFSTLDPEQRRIRTRYTERGMFEEEFRKICAAQRPLISEALERALYHAIFFQRKLKSCKHLIGFCRLEPEERRCSFQDPLAQRFRILQEVNHLRVDGRGVLRPLTEEERQKVLTVLDGLSGELNAQGTIALSALGRLAGLRRGEKFTLGDEDKKVYGNELHAILFRVFGARAAAMKEEERQAFFHHLACMEKDDALRRILRTRWGLSEEAAEKAAHISLPDDYCGFSRKALKQLLPDLESGIALSTVIKLKYPEQFQASERVLEFLPPLDETGLQLRNPVVHRTLTEMRQVVNAVIRKYGKPDLIRLELARDLKNSSKDRENITRRNRLREKERERIAREIAQEAGVEKPSRRDILKVMLAEECDYTCPYTGRRFSMRDLLHGGLVHIEHIVPYSRSMDDSFINKTLSCRDANAEKGNRLPFEAFSPEAYREILERVRRFKGPFAEAKLERFKMQKAESRDFIERNLNDTRYASKLATEYLALLYGGRWDRNGVLRLQCSAGGCTAVVRRAWGGNYLLGEGEKERGDFRHHAIDALTVAVVSPAIVKAVAEMPKETVRKAIEEKQPLIVNSLYTQARAKLDAAGISHHTINRARGAFHKETIYSKSHGGDLRHVRRRLDTLEPKTVAEIVDVAIRRAVEEKLAELKMTDPRKAFKDGGNLPVLRDRQGRFVNTIRSVRVRQNVKTRSIGEGDRKREVANGANLVLAIYARHDADGREIGWDGEVVTVLDARLRLQRNEPVFPKVKEGNPLKFTLRKGDVVRWSKDGQEYLCVIRGISLPQFSCMPINDARDVKTLKAAGLWFTPTLSAAFRGKMEKFHTTPLGELRRAND
ncbi:type II CRISPR RNA-guided endonuclease Cas9 [uncultured Victivallis sp.]|uniref:type II CRISPR RNA-guided endonuclease Cas9 n=1 Tax=uncultured Victivallis sp. TaxID=354118 RepID=UPI0025E503E2|nr:type II CRISPR RNA-guided endonuclease Cas9 [uncultured Victivallis sp.]